MVIMFLDWACKPNAVSEKCYLALSLLFSEAYGGFAALC